MKKGGYKIIDLNDTNITVGGEGVTVEGIYASIEANHRKPLLLSGVVIGGVEKSDMFINPAHSSNAYSASLYVDATDGLLTINITSEDKVTVTKPA